MRIAVAGTGYVGLSSAVLLARAHPVSAVDIVPEKVSQLSRGISPIHDDEISHFLSLGELQLEATLDGAAAFSTADLVIVATGAAARSGDIRTG